MDKAGNQGTSTGDTVAKETTLPSPGGGGVITYSNLTSSSVELAWSEATDAVSPQNTLQYKVVRSGSNNLDNIATAAIAATVSDWAASSSPVTAGSLTADTAYYFNILVRDEAGNMAVYTQINVVTAGTIPGDYIIRWRFNNDYNDELGTNDLTVIAGPPTYDAADSTEGSHSLILNGTTELSLAGFAFGDNTFSLSVWVYINPGAADFPSVFDWNNGFTGIFYDDTASIY